MVAGTTVVAGPLLAPAAAHASPAVQAGPGWRQVGEEDFDSSSLDPFTAYSGTPGCCHGTLWDPGQAAVVDGALRLRTSRNAAGTWVSGGAGGWNWAAGTREYGKWEARVRFGRGFGVWAALLLWPADDNWPPEVDFYEVFPTDAERRNLVATSHYGAANRLESSTQPGDFTGWHVVSVEWTANRLAYLLDGKVWSEVDDPAAIPHQPMWLGIQTTLGTCPQSCPSAATPATVDLNVDWVKVYAPASGSGTTASPTAPGRTATGPAVVRPSASAAPTAPASSRADTGTTVATPVGSPDISGRPTPSIAASHTGATGRGAAVGWVVALMVAAAAAGTVVGLRRRRRHRR